MKGQLGSPRLIGDDMARRMAKVDGNLYRKQEAGEWVGPFYAGATPPGQRQMRFQSLGTDKKGRAIERVGDAVKEIKGGSRASATLAATTTMDVLFDLALDQKR